MEHKDANKIYLYPKVTTQNSPYGYIRGIGEFFITHNGKDIEKCKTMEEVNKKLKIFRDKD